MNLPTYLPTVVNQPGWWQRYWKLALPIMILTPILATTMCAIGALWGIDKVVRQSQVYQLAWPRVQQDAQVIAALGQPIAESWSASIALDEQPDGSSIAYLLFNIQGPRRHATVESQGLRTQGTWQLESLKVHVQNHTIDLMPAPPKAPASPKP